MPEETRTFTAEELKEYSDVVARAEREACAMISQKHGEFCDYEARNGGDRSLFERAKGAFYMASLIRKQPWKPATPATVAEG